MEVEGQPTPDENIETPEVIEDAPTAGGDATPSLEEPPAYEPNLKFKVHGEEKEFDDWAKGLVKDPESEQQFREIMEKVHGIDYIKQDREQLREQLTEMQEFQTKYHNLEQDINTLDQFIQNKNFDAFFQMTQIKEQDILQWAAKRLQYYEMSPEQRQEYDRAVQAQMNEVYFGQHAQTLEQQMQALKYEQNQFRLDQQLTQPGIAEKVQQYDQLRGEQGAFRKAVEERGLYHYYQTGQDIPVEQAVQEVMQIIGMQTQAQSPAPMTPPQVGQTPPSTPPQVQKKPVIPKVQGSGTSPVKPGVRSIEDLKKLAASRS